MKLELKHLAPYLDCGIEIKCKLYKFGEVVRTMGIRTIDPDPVFNKNLEIETPTEPFLQIGIGHVLGDPTYKPILRPLSELEKESTIRELYYGVLGTDRECFDKDEFTENCELGLVDHLPFMVVQKLFEWHFDVFGLIDEGLANAK